MRDVRFTVQFITILMGKHMINLWVSKCSWTPLCIYTNVRYILHIFKIQATCVALKVPETSSFAGFGPSLWAPSETMGESSLKWRHLGVSFSLTGAKSGEWRLLGWFLILMKWIIPSCGTSKLFFHVFFSLEPLRRLNDGMDAGSLIFLVGCLMVPLKNGGDTGTPKIPIKNPMEIPHSWAMFLHFPWERWGHRSLGAWTYGGPWTYRDHSDCCLG